LHLITFSEANAKCDILNVCANVLKLYKKCVDQQKKSFPNEIVARWFLYKTFFLLGLTKKHGFAKTLDTV
jgi:hypothetical protein